MLSAEGQRNQLTALWGLDFPRSRCEERLMPRAVRGRGGRREEGKGNRGGEIVRPLTLAKKPRDALRKPVLCGQKNEARVLYRPVTGD
jgi:hypothetical protein